MQKVLVPGALIVIAKKWHINKLGLILSKKLSQYMVLVLADPNEADSGECKKHTVTTF